MSDQPETLAAILAEMRAELDCIDDTKVIPVVYIKNRLPRIEAAAEREREAYCDLCKEKDATIDRLLVERDKALKECAPGNAAAMRDLLEKIRHEYGWGLISCRTCVSSESDVERVSDLFEKQIDAALGAPARNCDRFKTEADAHLEYLGIFDHPDPVHYAKWLFAPEGGAE